MCFHKSWDYLLLNKPRMAYITEPTTARMVSTKVKMGKPRDNQLSRAFPPNAPMTTIAIICNAKLLYLA